MAACKEHRSATAFLNRVEFPNDACQSAMRAIVVQVIRVRITGEVEHPAPAVRLEVVVSVGSDG